MRLAVMSVVVLVAIAVAACGDEDPVASTQEVVTVTQTETVVMDEQEDPPPVNSSAADASTKDTADGKTIEVPDVVGQDHQLAQDTMQAAGLYDLREEDATGDGRALIIDRNWTVVRQSPKAGARVGDDTVVTLYSKKDDE